MLIKAILDLKKGIETKDWDLVEAAYQYLAGEKSSDNSLMAEVEPRKESKKVPLKSKVFADKKLVSKKTKIKGRKEPLILITDEPDPDFIEHNEAISQPKNYRPEQSKTKVKCSECNKEFILEKVYPMGRKGTKDLINLRCGKCSNNVKIGN